MTQIEYTCRFCKTTRTFEADITEHTVAGVRLNLATWLENLCCERCGEYQKAKARLRDRLYKTTGFLLHARQTGAKTLPDVESACKAKLTALAREFNSLVAGHYFREDIYDDQFGEQLFQRPEKVNLCLRIQTNAILGHSEERTSNAACPA